jgi:hypothetical protein
VQRNAEGLTEYVQRSPFEQELGDTQHVSQIKMNRPLKKFITGKQQNRLIFN